MSNLYSPELYPISTSTRPLLVPSFSPIYPLSDPFSCMHLQFGSLTLHHPGSETPIKLCYSHQSFPINNFALREATGSVKTTSIDHLHEDTKMNPIQDHIFLIGSQYLARPLQPNNPFHSEVTFPSGIKNKTKKISFNLDFSIVLFNICRTVFYPPLIMGPPSSPFTLKQFPISNLFQLITVSFRMLSRK